MAIHYYPQRTSCLVMSMGDLHYPHVQRDSALPGRDCSMEHRWLCHLGPLSTLRVRWQSGLGMPYVHCRRCMQGLAERSHVLRQPLK